MPKVFEHYGSHTNPAFIGNQKVKCPVHGDSTPSCSMNAEKGVYNCFACGSAGNAITLIMEKEGLGVEAAIEFALDNKFEKQYTAQVQSRRVPGSARGRQSKKKGGPGKFRPSWRP